jgi:hypothetical protein
MCRNYVGFIKDQHVRLIQGLVARANSSQLDYVGFVKNEHARVLYSSN